MLTGPQIGVLRDTITQSFDEADFEQFLKIRLNQDLSACTKDGDFPYKVFNVIKKANSKGWDSDLIKELQSERPKNEAVHLLAHDLKLGKEILYKENPITSYSLERLLDDEPYIDPETLLVGLYRTKNCMCRIEITDLNGSTSYGTGFLIGPDIVISNYHVFEKVIRDKTLAATTLCRFDYFLKADGTLNPGIEISLASDPTLYYSEPSALDFNPPENIEAAWPDDRFDYAIMKLEKQIGNEPFGSNAEFVVPSDLNKRGWISSFNANTDALNNGANVIILQHPKRQPLKIALGMKDILGSDGNHRRVRYSVNTEPGSSGSPCFDEKFNWIALHNMGDPDGIPTYNQGITAISIIADLKKKGCTNIDICK